MKPLIRVITSSTFLLLCLTKWNCSHGKERYVLLPAEITLFGPHSTQQLVVERFFGEISFGSYRGKAKFYSGDSSICRVEEDRVIPVGDGQTTVFGEVDNQLIESQVFVTGMKDGSLRSFRNDVLPILAKTGCNMGACHGALAGKGGFKLSLRGYNPTADYQSIAHESKGRRIELMDPGRSLILAKPSGALPHKGGIRFEVNSREYQILAEWISQGATPPEEVDAVTISLDVIPAHAQLSADGVQQIVVQALYSDGKRRDVTHWCKFESVNESVVGVNEDGLLQVRGCGEGAVTAWFDSKIAIARVTVPYENDISFFNYSETPCEGFIDELVLNKLESLRLIPSLQADDATLVRRAFIDTIGTLPTAEEVRNYVEDLSPHKWEDLIDNLLNRPEFVDYWTYKWSDLLLVNGRLLRPQAVKAYYHWIRQQVEKNMPWDEFARELLTAQGDAFENGATNFYAIHQDPESMVENASLAFLGLSLGCAKCHNHPLEKWTNDQYYAMANLFARVRGKGWGGDPRSGDGKRTVYIASSGDLLQPSTGKPQPPTPLDGESLDLDWPGDRRKALVDWMTSTDNPYFTRAIVNRVWANFFGVGLVEPVDDMRESNPASNEELLSAAAAFLIEHNYDLKSLIRTILLSKTYQRRSDSIPENKKENRFYSRYYPRRMSAEVLHDAICQTTGVPSTFTEIDFPSSDKYPTEFYPEGTRALQLYDSAVVSKFLSSFGRNPRTITCECERSNTPSIVQVLHLSNGDTINDKLRQKEGRVNELLSKDLSLLELLEQTFLTTLGRLPNQVETLELLPQLSEDNYAAKREALEDLFWGILSSKEFMFNH